jgi:diguanylate cyclase (GGDEF)-like protein
MTKQRKYNSERDQIRLSELIFSINKLEENIRNEKLDLSQLGLPIALMRHRAEEAEAALEISDIAREALTTLLNNSQEAIHYSDIAITALKATIKENDADLLIKQQAIEALSKISQQNRDNIKASAIALTAVTQLAYNDSLTNLPNRRLLSDRLRRTIIYNKRSDSYSAALFFDLDKFKLLNDKFGHEAGDELLVALSNRLKICVRESDTVARYGGDEFVILLSSLFGNLVDARSEAEDIAKKILVNLSVPYPIHISENGVKKVVQYRISMSIGVAMFSGDATIETSILDWADEAMYWAKSDGGNLVRFYDALNSTEQTLLTLYDLATANDIETSNHGIRTRQYVKTLAQRALQMNLYPSQLSHQMIDRMFKITQLHDIGKTRVPYAILHKKAKFTEAEWDVMKSHTSLGEALLLEAKKQNSNLEAILNVAIDIAGAHHEHWNGSGYPRALSGDDIPIGGRIMAVADVYDALISKRSYKEKWSHQDACNEIISKSGSQFDPMLIEAFILEMESFRLIAENNKDS